MSDYGSDDGRVEDDGDDDEVEIEKLPPGTFKVRPSGFKGLPPTVYVDYPADLEEIRTDIGSVELLGNRTLHFKCAWERTCIKNCFQRAGFVKGDTNWTAMWSKHQTDSQMKDLNCLQKINHFPGSWCVGRKDRLLTTINAMKRIRGHAFDFHPDGFVLPHEFDALLRVVRAEADAAKRSTKKVTNNLWILKPVAASQGKGIKVVNSQQVLDWMGAKPNKGKSALFQRYLYDPYLINGHKFDLRIYVLVTGVDPLRVYIHQEGLTRISTVAYSLKNTKNRFAHLTNYSINKKSAAFVAASEPCGVDGLDDNADIEGFKWSLRGFKKWLSKEESPEIMERTFQKINDLVVKTMIAAEAEMTPRMHNAANYRTNCFELFGLDVILDTKLEPSLLEVNISPSLMGSSPLDKKIKGTLVADILHVVGMYPHDESWLRKISRIDENQAGASASGGSRPRSVTPTKSGKTKRRTRSLSRGKEKAGVVGGGSGSTKEGSKNATVDHESHHRSSSVSNNPHSSTRPPAEKESAEAPQFLLNPFAFNSLAILMNNQDEWRRNPCCDNVDFSQFKGPSSSPRSTQNVTRGRNASRGESSSKPPPPRPAAAAAATDSIWVILLMIEDEFARAAHSHFNLLHPSPHTVVDYLKLYRSARFSDHLIGKWVLNNGMYGKLREFVPTKFIKSSFAGSGVSSPVKGSDRSSTKMKLVQDVLRNRGEAGTQNSPNKSPKVRSPVLATTNIDLGSGARNIPFSPISSDSVTVDMCAAASTSCSPLPDSTDGVLSNFQRLQLARDELSPSSMKNTSSSAAHFARRSAEKAEREAQRNLVSSIAARLSPAASNTTIVLNDNNVYQEPCLSARSGSNKSISSRTGRSPSSDRLLQRPRSANQLNHSGSRKGQGADDDAFVQANVIRIAGANVVGHHQTVNNIASGLALSSAAARTGGSNAARAAGLQLDMGVTGSRPPSAGTGRVNSARSVGGTNPDARGYNTVGSAGGDARKKVVSSQQPEGASNVSSNAEGHTIRLSYGMQLPGI